MEKKLYTLILSCVVLILLPKHSYAEDMKFIFDAAEKYGFSGDNRLDNDELSDLRGGFRVGTLNFDFAITTRTLVDGVLQHTATLTSTEFAERAQSLSNQSSTGTGIVKAGVDVAIIDDSLVTTIQNDHDNAVIQQLNQLDLVVSNLNELQKSNIAQQVDFQAIQVIH